MKTKLPPSCPKCRPFGGLWRRSDQVGWMERCDCPRGVALSGTPKREPPTRKARDGRMEAAGSDV